MLPLKDTSEVPCASTTEFFFLALKWVFSYELENFLDSLVCKKYNASKAGHVGATFLSSVPSSTGGYVFATKLAYRLPPCLRNLVVLNFTVALC